VRFEIKDLKRDEFPEYPIEAYREAIVNAVIHFDYYLGDTIAIEKLKNSIVINNKEELLFPESDFGKRSEARNRLLVDLLARTDFMEKAGTGIKRVTDACYANGNKCTFHFSDAFWVTIETNVPDNVPDKRTELIIDLIKKNNQIHLKDLAITLKVSTRTKLTKVVRLCDSVRPGSQKCSALKDAGRTNPEETGRSLQRSRLPLSEQYFL